MTFDQLLTDNQNVGQLNLVYGSFLKIFKFDPISLFSLTEILFLRCVKLKQKRYSYLCLYLVLLVWNS